MTLRLGEKVPESIRRKKEKCLQEWKTKRKGRERGKRRGEETKAGRNARKQKQGERQGNKQGGMQEMQGNRSREECRLSVRKENYNFNAGKN